MPSPASGPVSHDVQEHRGDPDSESHWSLLPRGSPLQDAGVEDPLATASNMESPKDKAPIILASAPSFTVLATPAMPTASPLIVSSRWQLSSLDLEHRVRLAATEPDLYAPRLGLEGYPSNERQPRPFIFPPRKPPDPLADVLDWLGQSKLGKDLRFLPPEGPGSALELELDQLMDPEVNISTDARELFADIADEEGLARVQQPRSREPKQGKSPVHAPSSCPALSSLSLFMHPSPPPTVPGNDEEDEWNQRQDRTGTVGRLVIYSTDDDPRDDFLMRGGGDRHFVVTALADGGSASKAGVKAGDRLVSINGKKDFVGMTPESLLKYLQPPAMLVFLGFVGKLHAEVRLTCTERAAGLPLRYEVARGYADAPLQVYEEAVFDAGLAPLFLAVAEGDSRGNYGNLVLTPMFELRRAEALNLVRTALSGFSQTAGVGQGGTREDVIAVAPRKPPGDHGAPVMDDDLTHPRLVTNVPRAAPLRTPREGALSMLRGQRSFISPRGQRSLISPRTWTSGSHTHGPRTAVKKAPCSDPEEGPGMCDEPCFS